MVLDNVDRVTVISTGWWTKAHDRCFARRNIFIWSGSAAQA